MFPGTVAFTCLLLTGKTSWELQQAGRASKSIALTFLSWSCGDEIGRGSHRRSPSRRGCGDGNANRCGSRVPKDGSLPGEELDVEGSGGLDQPDSKLGFSAGNRPTAHAG